MAIIRTVANGITKIELSNENKNGIPVLPVNLYYTKNVEYRFFYMGNYNLLKTVVSIIEKAGKDPEFKLSPKDYNILISAMWAVYHEKDKLQGLTSVSSSVIDNILCQCRRAMEGCICSACYAENQQEYQYGLCEHNIINGIIMRNILIPVSYWKKIKFDTLYNRVESFGDCANLIQAVNAVRIIKANPRKHFAIWSKNPEFYYRAFEQEGKPSNCTYVHSSSKINVVDSWISESKYSKYIDHVFTVYEKDFAAENGIIINCGGRKCMECIRKKSGCYFHNDTMYINELRK